MILSCSLLPNKLALCFCIFYFIIVCVNQIVLNIIVNLFTKFCSMQLISMMVFHVHIFIMYAHKWKLHMLWLPTITTKFCLRSATWMKVHHNVLYSGIVVVFFKRTCYYVFVIVEINSSSWIGLLWIMIINTIVFLGLDSNLSDSWFVVTFLFPFSIYDFLFQIFWTGFFVVVL